MWILKEMLSKSLFHTKICHKYVVQDFPDYFFPLNTLINFINFLIGTRLICLIFLKFYNRFFEITLIIVFH